MLIRWHCGHRAERADFSTTLRSADGKIVIVPNKKVIDGNITNFSREPVRRNELIIGVGYDSDTELVKS